MESDEEPTYKELEDQIAELKRQNETLKFSENLENRLLEDKLNSKLLFENMPSAFVYAKLLYIDNKAVDFEYVEVNSAFTKLTGIENVVGKNKSDVLPVIQDSDPKMFEIFERVALTGIPEHIEYFEKALKKWISIKLFSPKKGYFISVADDITNRKQIEEELLKAKEKAEEGESYLYNIINNIGDPTFVKDNQSRLIIVNDSFCEIFGLSRGNIIGKTLAEDVSIEEREHFLKIDREVLLTGIESVQEESLTVRDGHTRIISTRKTRFINSDGEKFLVGVIHDITGRFKIENELKTAKESAEENEERFRLLMLNMEAGIIVHAPDTSIIQSNVRASEILGLSSEQLKGKMAIDPSWKFVKNDTSPLPLAEYPVNRIQSTKKPIKNQLLGVYQSDKKDIIWVTLNGFPVVNNNGDVTEIVTIFVDITQQKLFEDAQIKHQRLKAIGEMSSSIAHDFNNALQEIMGNLEIVKFQKELSENTLKRLNNIGSIIIDIASRVSSLQKFGDTENDDKNAQLINFNKLIEESLEQSRPLWKDGKEKEGFKITVVTEFEDIPKISCNSGELKSVIFNLIKNSVEAMPEGGGLIIETGVKSDNVFATFTDTGDGMDEEAKLKVFEPFFTTKGFTLGRGLGMSGVYSIVKKYKGDIFVKSSDLNKGTTIEIVFPISFQNEIEILSENQEKDKVLYSVLWVDDDLIIAKSAGLLVESIGHSCKIVNSGIKALDYLNTNSCDIVFTDIGMPKMNGWELATAIRKKFGNKIKIIAVTGWDIEKKEKEAHGIDYVLQKPFTLEELKKMFLLV